MEWHGKQNLVGLDALKAHELCVQAARAGGRLGVAGALWRASVASTSPHTFVMEPEGSLAGGLIAPLGSRRYARRPSARASRRSSSSRAITAPGPTDHRARTGCADEPRVETCRSWARPEYILALDEGLHGRPTPPGGETSLMMHLYPGKRRPGAPGRGPPTRGVGGRDPQTLRQHRRWQNAWRTRSLNGWPALGERMPQWDEGTLKPLHRRRGGRSSVASLRLAGQSGSPWDRLAQDRRWARQSSLTGSSLVDERFEDIERIAGRVVAQVGGGVDFPVHPQRS